MCKCERLRTDTPIHDIFKTCIPSVKVPTQDTPTLAKMSSPSTSPHGVWFIYSLQFWRPLYATDDTMESAQIRNYQCEQLCFGWWAIVFDIYLRVPLTRRTRAKWRKQKSERRNTLSQHPNIPVIDNGVLCWYLLPRHPVYLFSVSAIHENSQRPFIYINRGKLHSQFREECS